MKTVNVDPRILASFKKLVARSRMGHAYLFVGPKETGKTQTAFAIAQLVNCESSSDQPCHKCSSCLKIEGGNHPDVTLIEPQEGSIKIDQIRVLLGRLQLKAFEAKTKVFIIGNIETMTLEAANSLLKTLEEPAANTLMILTTSVPEANLDTIRSRCHVVKFFPASQNRIREVLNITAQEALFLSGYTDGCLGAARQLTDNGFIGRKNQILDHFLLKSGEDLFKKSTSEKEDAKQALHVLLSLVRDALLFKGSLPAESLMNADRLKDLQALSSHSTEELGAIYQQLIKTKELLDENLNAKMAFNILRQRL